MNAERRLTVIIVFLNEKEEVKNTVDSLLAHLVEPVDILVINDCSDDGYDYRSDLVGRDVIYLENKERRGVAASRDKGVRLCRTPYFLFLDAHMRFYDREWYPLLMRELEKNEPCIYCSQTRFLKQTDQGIVEEARDQTPYGAYLHLKVPERFFELQWLLAQSPDDERRPVIPVPCLIGAAYAAGKTYWEQLHGLWGLEKYGLDEAYLSIKAYLSGGSCKLIKPFVTGHIYRQYAPYFIGNVSQLHNKLLLLLLLAPGEVQRRCFANYRTYYYGFFEEALRPIHARIGEIARQKSYYRTLLTNSFETYYRYNYALAPAGDDPSPEKILAGLERIARHIREYWDDFESDGLLEGRLGGILFLFHYAHFAGDPEIRQFAFSSLAALLSKPAGTVELGDGLLGRAWALEYLYRNAFLTAEEYDRSDLSVPLFSALENHHWEDLNLHTGLGGCLRYLLARLYANRTGTPFGGGDWAALASRLYEAARSVIEEKRETDCIDTYLEFVWRYEEQAVVEPVVSLYDICYLFTPDRFEIEEMVLGLDGLAGIGLDILLNYPTMLSSACCRR